MKVTVSITPASGKKPDDQTVEVDATGASLEAVLDKAKIKFDDTKTFLVDSEPATLKTHVAQGSKVSVTEKVRGS